MPIPVITNFSINDTKPLDDRLVVTSSSARDAILYKFAGLTVYVTDEGKNYQWNGTSWGLVGSGIYGGSGLLGGDVIVDTTANSTQRDPNLYGNPGDLGYQNLEFIISASASSSNRSYFRQFFRTKEASVLSTSQEYIMGFQPINDTLSTNYSGLKFNSSDGLNTNKNGSVSIWTSPLTSISQSLLRFQVEGDGTIRFKPNSSITSFLNITGTGANPTTIQMGFNWEGSGKSISGIGSSYIEFKDGDINFYNLKISTTSPVKTFTITEDNVNVFKSFLVNSPSQYLGFLGGGGIRSGSEGTPTNIQFYAYLTWRTVSGAFTDLLRFNNSALRVLKNIEIGSPSDFISVPDIIGNQSALVTHGPLNARYYVSIWDDKFVSDSEDNNWVFDSGDSDNTLNGSSFNQQTNSVCVVKESDLGYSNQVQDCYFVMIPRAYNATNPSKSVWELSSQPYDRMIYFHLDHLEDGGSPKNFTHHLSWYLTDQEQIVGGGESATTRAWKKIGKLETGNRDGINMMTASYSVPYYSQQVLVPANMYMKLIFKFPYSIPTANLGWPAASEDYRDYIVNLPILVVTSIRSGLFNTSKFSRGPIDSISGTDYLKNE